MARRSRGRFIRPQSRTKMWIGMGVGATAVAGNSQVLVSTLSAGALLLRPFTILRSHLMLQVHSDQFTAIESSIASYGQIVITETAAALGVTAVPDPSGISGDPDADWFLWQGLSNTFFIDVNGTDGIGVDGDLGHKWEIDSRAMRKVGPDDNIVATISSDNALGFTLTTVGRRLIQLH